MNITKDRLLHPINSLNYVTMHVFPLKKEEKKKKKKKEAIHWRKL